VGKAARNGKIRQAGERFPYRRQEAARHTGLHTTTIIRRLKKR
jgi:hypothetical protein